MTKSRENPNKSTEKAKINFYFMPTLMVNRKYNDLKRFIHSRQNTQPKGTKHLGIILNVWVQMKNTTETCCEVQKKV